MGSRYLPVKLDEILHGKAVEWERLEFKAGWNPKAVLHTLCAFANDFHNLGGGYIVLGVEERNGTPVLPPTGLETSELDAIQKELLNLGENDIRPKYHPTLIPYQVSGRMVAILWVPGGQSRPYKARTNLGKDEREFAYYIRKGSSTVKAAGADEQELMGLTATVPFDDRINQRARVSDLSTALVSEYLAVVGSDLASLASQTDALALYRQMNIVGGPDEAPFPLNVGLLFFSPEPHRFFPGAQVDVVWFPDGPGGDKFVEKVFRGPLFRMVPEVLSYVRRNYLNEIVVKHSDRAESTRVANFPYDALEEAIANAVYHRSYEEREPVEVRISPEEIVVLSYPGPDRSVSLEQLRLGRAVPRRYRNRRIGEFLKELNLTEGRATGIPKILRAMSQNGSPAPEFEFDPDHTYFMVRLPVHPDATAPTTGEVTGEVERRPNAERVTEQVTEQVGVASVAGPRAGEVGCDTNAKSLDSTTQVAIQDTTQVATQVDISREIASLVGAVSGEMTRDELQTTLGLRNRRHFRYSYLLPALQGGWLEMTRPAEPTSPLQRYRLTPKAKAWLAQHAKGMKP